MLDVEYLLTIQSVDSEAERFQLQAVRTYLKDWYDAEHSGWDCPPMPDQLDKVLIHITALLRSTGGVA